MAVRLHTAAPFRTQASSARKPKEGAGGLGLLVEVGSLGPRLLLHGSGAAAGPGQLLREVALRRTPSGWKRARSPGARRSRFGAPLATRLQDGKRSSRRRQTE